MRAAEAQGVESGQRRGEETRRRILQAALDLFAREGFERTTVRAIADACALTDAALYYHFPSKQAILTALWERPRAGDLRALPVAPVLTDEILAELVDSMLNAVSTQDALVRLLVQQALAGDATAVAMRDEAMGLWRGYLLPHFEASFEPKEAALRVDLLMMLIIGETLSGEMDHGTAYASLSAQPAYRERVQALARSVLGSNHRVRV